MIINELSKKMTKKHITIGLFFTLIHNLFAWMQVVQKNRRPGDGPPMMRCIMERLHLAEPAAVAEVGHGGVDGVEHAVEGYTFVEV